MLCRKLNMSRQQGQISKAPSGLTTLLRCGLVAAGLSVGEQLFCKLRESAAAQHVHNRSLILNLLALQFEQGKPLSQRILRVRQLSHCM